MGKRQTSTSTTLVSSVLDALRLLISAIASLLHQVTLPLTQHLFSRCATLLNFLSEMVSIHIMRWLTLGHTLYTRMQEAIGTGTAGSRSQDQQGM